MSWLETERLLIRPWTAGDREAFTAMASDPEVMRYVHDPGNEPSKRVVGRLGMRYDSRATGAELGYRKPEIVVDVFVRERAP
jgi:RimJ/RimL family protein N-acetyltransferase